MTGPDTTTTTSTSQDGDSREAADRGSDTSTQETGQPAVSENELTELAETQEDVAQRVRQLVAADLATHARDGETDDEHVDRLLTSARADLLADLRQQEQEQARRQLAEATRGGEEAVAGVVQGITTIVRKRRARCSRPAGGRHRGDVRPR